MSWTAPTWREPSQEGELTGIWLKQFHGDLLALTGEQTPAQGAICYMCRLHLIAMVVSIFVYTVVLVGRLL